MAAKKPAEPEFESISDLLIWVIADGGWTQREAAEQMGVSQPALSQWMRANNVPKPEYLEAISRFTGVPVDDLDVMRRNLKRATITQQRIEELEWSIRLIQRDLIALTQGVRDQKIQNDRRDRRRS